MRYSESCHCLTRKQSSVYQYGASNEIRNICSCSLLLLPWGEKGSRMNERTKKMHSRTDFGGNRELSEASRFHSTCPPARTLPRKRRAEKEQIIDGPTAHAALERPFADVLLCPWTFALACCEGNVTAQALNAASPSTQSCTELPAELTGVLFFVCYSETSKLGPSHIVTATSGSAAWSAAAACDCQLPLAGQGPLAAAGCFVQDAGKTPVSELLLRLGCGRACSVPCLLHCRACPSAMAALEVWSSGTVDVEALLGESVGHSPDPE